MAAVFLSRFNSRAQTVTTLYKRCVWWMRFHRYRVNVPRCRPDCVCGDRAYAFQPKLAERNTDHGSGLGRWRWLVERTFAWLSQFRRLRVRYERRADIHEAFLSVAFLLICWNLFQGQSP